MNRIKAQRQWTPRERAELRQLRRQNVDYATLAQHFGRTTRAIASMVYAIDARGAKRPWRAADLIQLRHMASRGYSDNKIGMTIGRTRTAVSQKRERLGIAPGKPEHGPRRKAA